MINDFTYKIKVSKPINPLTYKGRGRPRKTDYLEDLSELIKVILSDDEK